MAFAALKAFWNSPVGPKTSHFWGPMANWGFVVAASSSLMFPLITCRKTAHPELLTKEGLVDMQKPVDMISPNMTSVMCVYSALFMRFAWKVQPRNYLLFSCHTANESVQLYQLSRWASAQDWSKMDLETLTKTPSKAPAATEPEKKE